MRQTFEKMNTRKLKTKETLIMNGLSTDNQMNESQQKPQIWPNPKMDNHLSLRGFLYH